MYNTHQILSLLKPGMAHTGPQSGNLLRSVQLCVFFGAACAIADLRAAPVEFNRDIRPILSDKCFTCHGPDPGARKTKLRFDQESGAQIELAKGRRAFVPGVQEASPRQEPRRLRRAVLFKSIDEEQRLAGVRPPPDDQELAPRMDARNRLQLGAQVGK